MSEIATERIPVPVTRFTNGAAIGSPSLSACVLRYSTPRIVPVMAPPVASTRTRAPRS